MTRRRAYRRHNPQYVLAWIERFYDLFGQMPTYEQIGRGCEISSKAQVKHVLERLQQAGKLRLTGRKRGILLPDATGEFEE